MLEVRAEARAGPARRCGLRPGVPRRPARRRRSARSSSWPFACDDRQAPRRGRPGSGPLPSRRSPGARPPGAELGEVGGEGCILVPPAGEPSAEPAERPAVRPAGVSGPAGRQRLQPLPAVRLRAPRLLRTRRGPPRRPPPAVRPPRGRATRPRPHLGLPVAPFPSGIRQLRRVPGPKGFRRSDNAASNFNGCGSSSSTAQGLLPAARQELLDPSKAWWGGRRGRLADWPPYSISVSLGVVPRWYSRVVEVPVRIEVAAGFVAPGASEPPRLQPSWPPGGSRPAHG